MSVNSSGNLPGAATLAAIMDSAHTTIRDLLGLTTMPELEVVTDIHTTNRVVSRPEQASILLGGLDMHGDTEGFWHVGLPNTDDWVRLSLLRQLDEPVDPATLTADEDDLWLHPSLDCDPKRTAVAMVHSVGLALGAAIAGGGNFTTQLTVWSPGVLADPAQVIAATRLTPNGQPYRDACIRYMEQFPTSKPSTGW